MKSRLPIRLLPIILAVLLCACGKKETKSQEQTEASGKVELTIGYSRLRISLPVFVAKENEIFAKHGIDAKLVMYDTAQPLMQALVEGRVEIAGYTALPITYNGMLRSKTKLYFLTAMVEDQQHRISYLLRKKTPPGEVPKIQTIADLQGKNVGILPTIAYKAWIEALLKANDVDPTSVNIQQIAPMLEGQTLTAGGVDALFTNDPAATSAIADGVAEPIVDFVEVPKYLGEPFLFGSFNVRKKWADAHPKAFSNLVTALDEAVEYVNEHPKQAKLAMKPYLPDAFKPHVELYPDARYLTTGETSEKAFTQVAEQYQQMGIIGEPLPLTGLVYGASDRAAPQVTQR